MLFLCIFLPRHVLNVSEVEEAQRRIREWRASPEAKEEGAVCPIAEVGTWYICLYLCLPSGGPEKQQDVGMYMGLPKKKQII